MDDTIEQMQQFIDSAYAILDKMVADMSPGDLAMTDYVIDDSALLHSVPPRDYDPVKAHKYYMRVRKLKGRKPKSPKQSNSSDMTDALKKSSQKEIDHAKSMFYDGLKALKSLFTGPSQPKDQTL